MSWKRSGTPDTSRTRSTGPNFREEFDKVWMGAHCKACLPRDVCGAY